MSGTLRLRLIAFNPYLILGKFTLSWVCLCQLGPKPPFQKINGLSFFINQFLLYSLQKNTASLLRVSDVGSRGVPRSPHATLGPARSTSNCAATLLF